MSSPLQSVGSHKTQSREANRDGTSVPQFCSSTHYDLTRHITDMRITHTLARQRRTPCFPQIDLIFRAIMHEKKPPFIILFSHQPASYSNIFFTHPLFVPDEDIYWDFPSGCPNICCNDECEMIRFPRRGVPSADVVALRRGGRHGGRRMRAQQMCNWIDCTVCFDDESPPQDTESQYSGSSEGSQTSGDGHDPPPKALVCSKCKLVKYCTPEHQKRDWEEHRRMCRKMT
jgi:hypothetical protein